MNTAHGCAAGMNGLRAAGDLVARLQMAKGMRIAAAKREVAGRLGVDETDLSDPLVMHEVRGELRLGRIFEAETVHFDDPSPQQAKGAIAALLGLHINGAGGGY
jgi:Dimethylamine methyltransferase (Dimeth_PyL)